MSRHVFHLFIKLTLFAVVMVVVAKVIPYEGLVDAIMVIFTYQSADRFTHFILGESDLEVWQSLNAYISILTNILISVPVMTVLITLCRAVKYKFIIIDLLRGLVSATLRRFAKIFSFTILFWVMFRLLPYDSVCPQQKYSTFAMAAIVSFHLFFTIACYWFIAKKITPKRIW